MRSKQDRLQGLYVITDSELAQQTTRSIEAMVEQAIAGGARIVQYRNKFAFPSVQEQEATNLAQLCREYGVTFLINDDIDLALCVDADGVHLGQTDMPLASARHQLGAEKIIGITCHNDLDLAQAAQAGGADYVAFGRFFPSRSKPGASAASLDTLTHAKKRLQIPVCAIGGITQTNAPLLIEHGVDMLAVIHAILAARDVEKAARQFAKLFT